MNQFLKRNSLLYITALASLVGFAYYFWLAFSSVAEKIASPYSNAYYGYQSQAYYPLLFQSLLLLIIGGLTQRYFKKEKTDEETISTIRRVAIILFLGVTVDILSDVISRFFIGGITQSTILVAASNILTLSCVGYFIIRGSLTEKRHETTIPILLSLMIVTTSIGLGVFAYGTPKERAVAQKDELKVSRMTNLAGAINLYIADHNKLPKSVEELFSAENKTSTVGFTRSDFTDPDTDSFFIFKDKGPISSVSPYGNNYSESNQKRAFVLCTTIGLDYERSIRFNDNSNFLSSEKPYAGNYCKTVTYTLYNPEP